MRSTPLILYMLVFLFLGLQSPRFFQLENLSNIVKNAAFTGVVAVGMTFVLLTGGIDLSVGSNIYPQPMIQASIIFLAAFLIACTFRA